jgi:DNA-binding transcriptional LysR family regulator
VIEAEIIDNSGGPERMKRAFLGAALILVPGSGIFYGAYLIYRATRKKPKSFRKFVEELKDEAKKDMENDRQRSS